MVYVQIQLTSFNGNMYILPGSVCHALA